jgi:hypothetical protein
MKNQAVTEAILDGGHISIVVVGNESEVGALKFNLRRINPNVSFGGSSGVSLGVISQVIRIPASGVEGIRRSTVSALEQSSLNIQLQPQPHHEIPPAK